MELNSIDIIRKENHYCFELKEANKKGEILELKNDCSNLYVSDSNYNYILINCDVDMASVSQENLVITFDSYFRSKSNISLGFNYSSKIIRFEIPVSLRNYISITNDLIIDLNKLKLYFNLSNSYLEVEIKGNLPDSRDLIEEYKVSQVVFNYIFLITGKFMQQMDETTYILNDSESISEFSISKHSQFKCIKFSMFSIEITNSFVIETLLNYFNFYLRNIYPLETFFLTQTNIKYNIQQRVALVLNSIEGLMRRELAKETFRISIDKKQKKKITDFVKKELKYIFESDEFEATIRELDDKTRKQVMDGFSGAIGRFTYLTFDDVLEESKKYCDKGHRFVIDAKMPVKFWSRCKKHRNFHAHLSDTVHNGFNGIQSVYAMYILSSYYRLLAIELCNMSYYFTDDVLKSEATSIEKWVIKSNIVQDINAIER